MPKMLKMKMKIGQGSLEIMKINSIGKTFYLKIVILLTKVMMQVMMIVTVTVD